MSGARGHDRDPGDDRIRLALRVRPGAGRDRVGGAYDGALVVAVSARAVDGAATEAALRATARALGLRRADVRLVTGATSRTKVVELCVEAARRVEVCARLEALRAGTDG